MARRKNSESIGNDSEFGDSYVEEPNFSDREDFVDDIDEEGMLRVYMTCCKRFYFNWKFRYHLIQSSNILL